MVVLQFCYQSRLLIFKKCVARLYSLFAGTNMSDFTSTIYQCALGKEDWDALLPKVYEALGCSSTAYSVVSTSNQQAILKNLYRLDPVLVDDYMRNWDYANPWRLAGVPQIQAMIRNKDIRSIHFSALLNDSNFKKSEVYERSLKKMDITDLISIPMRQCVDSPVGMLAFCGNQKGMFNDEDRRLADYLGLHLVQASELSDQLSNMKSVFKDGGLLKNHVAAVLMSEQRDLLDETPVIEKMLFTPNIATVKKGKFVFVNPVVENNFQRLLYELRFLANNPLPSSYVKEIRISYTLKAVVYRLSSVWEEITKVKLCNEYFIVFVSSPLSLSSAIELLSINYELSDAETDIAQRLAEGSTPDHIANVRKTSINTTRSQIKRIYAKLDVTSKSGFFSMLVNAMEQAKPE